jgi:hypothetical protein
MAGTDDNLIAFSKWLRQNKAVSLISSTGVIAGVEIVAKWVHFEGFTLSPQYLLPVLVGLIFLAGALFCVWAGTNPQIAGAVEGQAPRFALSTQRTAKILVAPLVVCGFCAVFFTLPAPRVPVAELKSLLAAVDLQAAKLVSAENTYRTYLSYQEARRRDPSGFWVDPDSWEIVATVDQDNSNFRAAIAGDTPLVSPQLAQWHGTGKAQGLDLKDVATTIAHYARADDLHNKIASFRPQNHEDQKELNEHLCTYWALVLNGDPAESRVREWLRVPKRSEPSWGSNR